MERYGISEEDSNGTVIWHSLNENGEVGVYDMKFGNTIVRNLTEVDLVEGHKNGHKRDDEHGAQPEDDPERGKKK